VTGGAQYSLLRYEDLVHGLRRALRRAQRAPHDVIGARWQRLERLAEAVGRRAAASTGSTPVSGVDAVRRALAQTPVLPDGQTRRTPMLRLHTTAVRDLPLCRRTAEGFENTRPFHLLLDATRLELTFCGGGEPHKMRVEGHITGLRILSELIRAGGGPLPLAQLFRLVWGRPLTEYDANTAYPHVCRLRRILDQLAPGVPILLASSAGYLLAPSLRCAVIEHRRPRRGVASGRDAVLALVADGHVLTQRSYRALTGATRHTALRDLTSMVQAGLLVREGGGRAARYRAPRS
jgi:hypothetical protein